jgi:DNA repair protein RecO (recombination protein O)
MVLETDAIVLKSIPFMETSRICTFYTRRIGRITAKALGAKRKKNKYLLLSGSYIIHPFTTIKRNIERFSSASLVIDFLYSLTPRDTGNSNLYNQSLLSLMRMKTVKNSLVPALTFLIKALTIIGYGINLKRCVICGEKENIAGISIPDGGVFEVQRKW